MTPTFAYPQGHLLAFRRKRIGAFIQVGDWHSASVLADRILDELFPHRWKG